MLLHLSNHVKAINLTHWDWTHTLCASALMFEAVTTNSHVNHVQANSDAISPDDKTQHVAPTFVMEQSSWACLPEDVGQCHGGAAGWEHGHVPLQTSTHKSELPWHNQAPARKANNALWLPPWIILQAFLEHQHLALPMHSFISPPIVLVWILVAFQNALEHVESCEWESTQRHLGEWQSHLPIANFTDHRCKWVLAFFFHQFVDVWWCNYCGVGACELGGCCSCCSMLFVVELVWGKWWGHKFEDPGNDACKNTLCTCLVVIFCSVRKCDIACMLEKFGTWHVKVSWKPSLGVDLLDPVGCTVCNMLHSSSSCAHGLLVETSWCGCSGFK